LFFLLWHFLLCVNKHRMVCQFEWGKLHGERYLDEDKINSF
jgi:hypothetical protein